MCRLEHFLLLCCMIGNLFFCSCSEREEGIIVEKTHEQLDREEVFSLMQQFYYWNNHVPDLCPDDFERVDEVFEACLWTPERGGPDRWSFMMTESEFWDWKSYGMTRGLGMSIQVCPDSDGELSALRVAYVNQPSPCFDAGFKRGDRISRINSFSETDLLTNRALLRAELSRDSCVMEGVDGAGNGFLRTVERGEVIVPGILAYDVFKVASQNVGYLAYKNFHSSHREKEALEHVIELFASENVRELILDLRYNGGGDIGTATTLAAFLTSSDKAGGIFSYLCHNPVVAGEWDKTLVLPEVATNLSLPRVFIIISAYTASASEMLINGLRPFMEVILIGSCTEGKPVGMWNLKVPFAPKESLFGRWRIAPICFGVSNALGEGDFYDGFSPDYPCSDDVDHPLGCDENNVRAALYYIGNNHFPPVSQEDISYSKSMSSSLLPGLTPLGLNRESAIW